MKVLLVKPCNLSDHIQPSLGLGYLATAIRGRHEVAILDCIKENVPVDRLETVLRESRPDVLGLQCYTFDLQFVTEALSAAKRVSREMVTAVGGPHPSAMPEDLFHRAGEDLDFAFVGEAETGFPMLLDGLQARAADYRAIPGLVWRDSGRIRSKLPAFPEDLDALGMPAWDIIRPETYPESQHGAFYRQFPIAPIMVTRGCPYSCTFCAGHVVSGRKIRRRSVGHVLGEIGYLSREFGIREFHIVDDNFTQDRAYAKALLRQLKEMNLGMSWAVPNGVRMDTLDGELLGLMKDTGLYLISLGIESGSDRMLKLMRKGMTKEGIRASVQMIRQAGIDMAGFFILGFPGETAGTIRETIRFSAELPLKRANYFTYLPFPGSESFRMLQAGGKLRNVDWTRFYFMNAAYTPDGLTRKALKRWQRLAFLRFYMRPGILAYQIRSIRSLRHLYYLAKRFFHWIVMR
jgi:anaerobic magnesium-protoporphyrin IX monomethyl ester cyclase